MSEPQADAQRGVPMVAMTPAIVAARTAWLANRGLLAPRAASAKATDDDRAVIERLTAERAQIER
jgi:hypothetical protein